MISTRARSSGFAASGNRAITDSLDEPAHENRFLFTGREWLSQLELYDYRNRMYSPDLGRFLQTDPIKFNAGDIDLYRYVFNDPVNATDPTGQGLWSWLKQLFNKGSKAEKKEESFEEACKKMKEKAEDRDDKFQDFLDSLDNPNATGEDAQKAADNYQDAMSDMNKATGDAAGAGSKIPGQPSSGIP